MKKYSSKLGFSYCLGVYQVIELLKYRARSAKKVILGNRSDKNQGVKFIKKFCRENNIFVEYDDKKIEQIAAKGNVLAVGVFAKYTDDIREGNHVCLVEPRNSGNLGTILRTALGFGMTEIAIVRPACDIFHPELVSASMGAIFSLNVCYFESFSEYKNKFLKQNLYAMVSDSGMPLCRVKFDKPFTLIFGNESRGLDKSVTAVSKLVSIPQSTKIDSLNLAVSVGIVLYSAKIAGTI